MKPKLITNIRSTDTRGWTESRMRVDELLKWVTANLPDTVAFNDCAAFGSDDDYILFKMKWSKTCSWQEDAVVEDAAEYLVRMARAGSARTAASLAGSSISAANAAGSAISASTRAGKAVIAIDLAASALAPIVVTRI